jgi:hypothetical protein
VVEVTSSDDDAGNQSAVAIADGSRRRLRQRQAAQVQPRLSAERLAPLGRIDAVEPDGAGRSVRADVERVALCTCKDGP